MDMADEISSNLILVYFPTLVSHHSHHLFTHETHIIYMWTGSNVPFSEHVIFLLFCAFVPTVISAWNTYFLSPSEAQSFMTI